MSDDVAKASSVHVTNDGTDHKQASKRNIRINLFEHTRLSSTSLFWRLKKKVPARGSRVVEEIYGDFFERRAQIAHLIELHILLI